jgi:hypothetical protein
LAGSLDPLIDLTLPATEHGDDSFSGRTLADKTITPLMRAKGIPVSASPYLSALRGGAKFIKGGEPRIQRDKKGFEALVRAVAYLQGLDKESRQTFLKDLLHRFIILRESSDIALTRTAKPNLHQLETLIAGLIKIKSGGRFPAFLTTALFQMLNDCHDLGWTVEFQGINVADKFSGAVGDITISKDGTVLLGIEVTERAIDKGRVTLTFDQKVSPSALPDYLFVTTAKPDDDAMAAARSYTTVGHEMNFVSIGPWLVSNLSVVGPRCRAIFLEKMLALMSAPGVSVDLKKAWNDEMSAAIGIH